MTDACNATRAERGEVKAALHALVNDAVRDITSRNERIDDHRNHVPFFNLEADTPFLGLTSVADAERQLALLPEVRQQYGADEVRRLTLQFLYAYLESARDLAMDDVCFESIWSRLERELSTPEWRYVGVTILQNFVSEVPRIELEDDVSICLRTLKDTQGAIAERELQWLEEDWLRGAVGSHCLVAQDRQLKEPRNIITGSQFGVYTKLQRALSALRVLKCGHPQTGAIYYIRPAELPHCLPGQSSSGYARRQFGETYQLDEPDIGPLRACYALLREFDERAPKEWVHIKTVALRRFNAVYENDYGQAEDRIVDAMIAFEALLGADQEITYRLSSRVAGLLGWTDDERAELFKEMKLYYETRSKIVHGGILKKKHHAALNNLGPLMSALRHLLLGFVRLATGSSRFHNRKRLGEQLDTVLLHAGDCEELRRAMGLSQLSRVDFNTRSDKTYRVRTESLNVGGEN